MSFVYTQNIPASGNLPAADQPNLQTNTNSINSIIDVDHYPFGTGIDGQHKYLHMKQGALPPGGVTGTGLFYTQASNGATQLYYSNGSTGNEYQLTRVNNANFGTFATNPGWTFLPGGLLMQWGTDTKATGGTVTFPFAFTSSVYSIQITVNENNNNRHTVFVKTSSMSNFTVASRDSSGNDESNTFFWVAIGV